LNYGELIVPRQLSANGVTVHVTAANQSFSVPVQERYCSIKCFNYGLKRAGMNQFSFYSFQHWFAYSRNDSNIKSYRYLSSCLLQSYCSDIRTVNKNQTGSYSNNVEIDLIFIV
jgi:hypothetical protein